MYSRSNNLLDFPVSLWHPHILFYIIRGWELLPESDSDLLKARNAETLFCTWAHKKYPNLKKMAPVTVNFTVLMVKQVALCKLQCPEFVYC